MNKSIDFKYYLELPFSYWKSYTSLSDEEREQQLRNDFPNATIRFSSRSMFPVLSNSTHKSLFDFKNDVLIGDELNMSFCGVLFDQKGMKIGSREKYYASLKLSYPEIFSLSFEDLLKKGQVFQHMKRVKNLQSANKQIWAWANVPGILYFCWYTRGDVFFQELNQSEDTQSKRQAIRLLQFFTDWYIGLQKYFMDLYRSPDQVRMYNPLCFLPLVNEQQALLKLSKIEAELQKICREELAVQPIFHTCATALSKAQYRFLKSLGITKQFEAMNVMEMKSNGVESENWIELLEGSCFSKNAKPPDKAFNVSLYDMDKDFSIQNIQNFILDNS